MIESPEDTFARSLLPGLSLATLLQARVTHFSRRTSNAPISVLESRQTNFDNPLEDCGVECSLGDNPSLPECHWDMCLASIEKTHCDQIEVTSVNDNTAEEQWKVTHAMFLYENLTMWYGNIENPNVNYVPYISDRLHGPPNMQCQVLAEHSGCNNFMQCDDTIYPAGHYILNSFVTIHNMLRNFYEGTQHARNDIEATLPELQSVFSPKAEKGIDTAIILDIVLMGYVSAAAPFRNSIAKNLPYFRKQGSDGSWKSHNSNTHGTLKDLVNGLVTSSLTLARDLTKSEAEAATNKDFIERVGLIIGTMAQTVDETATRIFDGSDSSRAWLYRMLKDGKFANNQDTTMSTEDIKQLIAKPIYAQMIPRAWQISNLPVGPFILKTGLNCEGDKFTDSKKVQVSDDVRDRNGVCKDGKWYILTSTPDPGKHCGSTGDYNSCLDDFQDLPGSSQLNGKTWAGVTMKDIAMAAVNTWKANGEKNTISAANVDNEISSIQDYGQHESSNDLIDRIMDSGVTAPGLVVLPVCSVFEANDNWLSAYNVNNFSPWAGWPCNQI